ncbi:hypothetical protein HX005_01525 [Acinetobacter sp. R933-2]|uniref:TfpX/TfpZ family type IV pilin accessory protein n=1 Tax=Acinetobacter sp. R933-2 TaxID=2746728 RepID=UPI0025780DBB|nr:TfpX/TfpZ family type IV pilin accessory protein [Acinetobacter sp. R933-2]MDM1246083.1 hypothetical protein [Acinetobacter sp. R933-2]
MGLSFRIKLFFGHLCVSIILALVCFILVYIFWHPFPLAKAIGVTHIFIMMLCIDTVLGPLLTLIVAKKGKKTLKFDLVIIFILQISALVYGVYNISISRPVYIVFDTFRFDLVQANNIPKKLLTSADQPFNTLPLFTQNWVAVQSASSEKEKSDRTFWELEQGVAPSMMPNLYVPLSKYMSQVKSKSLDLSLLNEFNAKEDVNAIIKKYPQADSWVPLKANAVDMVVLINKEKGEVVKIVDLRPWK